MSSRFRISVTGKRISAPSRSEWVATDKWLLGEMKTTKEGIRPVKKHLSVRKQMELAILDGKARQIRRIHFKNTSVHLCAEPAG